MRPALAALVVATCASGWVWSDPLWDCSDVLGSEPCGDCVAINCVCASSTMCTHMHLCLTVPRISPIFGPGWFYRRIGEIPCEIVNVCARRDANAPCHDWLNPCRNTGFTQEVVSRTAVWERDRECYVGISAPG